MKIEKLLISSRRTEAKLSAVIFYFAVVLFYSIGMQKIQNIFLEIIELHTIFT